MEFTVEELRGLQEGTASEDVVRRAKEKGLDFYPQTQAAGAGAAGSAAASDDAAVAAAAAAGGSAVAGAAAPAGATALELQPGQEFTIEGHAFTVQPVAVVPDAAAVAAAEATRAAAGGAGGDEPDPAAEAAAAIAARAAAVAALPAIHPTTASSGVAGYSDLAGQPRGVVRYQYQRWFLAEKQNRTPSILVRQWGKDDRAIIDYMGGLHRMLAMGDRQGALQLAVQHRALAEGTGASGGFLVPDEFAQDVIAVMGDLTPLANRQFLRIIPMGREVMKVPTFDIRPTIDKIGEGASGEGGTDPGWGQVELVARKYGRVLPMSMELLEDSTVGLIEFLRDIYAEILAEKRNSLITNGTGLGEPEGIRTNVDIPTVAFVGTEGNASDTVTWINKIYYTPKEAYRRRALWFASAAMLESLDATTDADGRPLIAPDLAGQPFRTLKGRPIFENNAIPDNLGGGSDESELLFADTAAAYVFGDRQLMTVATDQGGKYFENDQVALKVTERYDGKVAQAEAFVRGTAYQV